MAICSSFPHMTSTPDRWRRLRDLKTRPRFRLALGILIALFWLAVAVGFAIKAFVLLRQLPNI
jgi:hypothetical protein